MISFGGLLILMIFLCTKTQKKSKRMINYPESMINYPESGRQLNSSLAAHCKMKFRVLRNSRNNRGLRKMKLQL